MLLCASSSLKPLDVPPLLKGFIAHVAPSQQVTSPAPPAAIYCLIIHGRSSRTVAYMHNTLQLQQIVTDCWVKQWFRFHGALMLVDDVAWVLHDTTALFSATMKRKINGPERRWREPSFSMPRVLFHLLQHSCSSFLEYIGSHPHFRSSYPACCFMNRRRCHTQLPPNRHLSPPVQILHHHPNTQTRVSSLSRPSTTSPLLLSIYHLHSCLYMHTRQLNLVLPSIKLVQSTLTQLSSQQPYPSLTPLLP